ncbi:hybrid sensor histidine kinase/response regulator [Aliifodinibius sp. S!AR15-10]|uniref:hybrid sensor histidine kinase/response regulator n=1 Tax=Aliifodinibius sp. S!AR15-10 TaxID=2950437 RepID=UPI00285AE1B1|nr:hybrid sensor histidine kinase/response regulator [Aliifodinibius sp. S!AR15-10]MDR8391007.1 hybrid sensor histidine kinase/response regulator [Aliifodinibius sp. S!AR15-10]
MPDHSDTTTILIVDDSEQNVRLLSHVLKKEGYKILEALNGRKALDIVAEKAPDIILLDVIMPDLNGFEICKKLKDQQSTKDIPIIFLSSLSETDSKVKGFNVGGVDYITKPFQREEVLARIDLHVRLKQLQDELEEKIDELKEREQRLNALNKRKDELMRILSHDIRNPVTGIIGVAQLLSESSEDLSMEDRETMYHSIEESGRKIQRLVNDLLNKGTAERSISELNTEQVNVDEMVKEVIELHQPTALTKKISFDLESDKEIELRLDRQKMEQVVGNLISNALKFTPEGGTISIGVDKNTEKDQVEIKVSDNGVGIPENELPDLLTDDGPKNVRTGTNGEKGSGIGLDIIKQFTELHGGSVLIDSCQGEGTTFTIKLPNIN